MAIFKLKATVLLTWLLAAESAYSLPQVGTAVESILQKTATEKASTFETQYPPKNENSRLLIPESHPVSLWQRGFESPMLILTELGISTRFTNRRSSSSTSFPGA